MTDSDADAGSGQDATKPQSDSVAGEQSSSWLDRHLWQIQPVRDVGVFFAVLGLLWLGQKAAVVTVPVLLAVLFAYLFEPIVCLIVRKTRFSRQGAVASILVAAVVFIVVPAVIGIVFGTVQLAQFVTETAHRADLVSASIAAPDSAEASARVEELGSSWVWIRDQLAVNMDSEAWQNAFESVRDRLRENAGGILGSTATAGADLIAGALAFVGGVFSFGFMVFLTAFFFFFISSSWGGVQDFAVRLLPDKQRDTIIELAKKFDRVIAAFIRGRLTIAFLQSIVFSVGYMAIGVPASFILGPLVAVLSIVPYLALAGIPISVSLLWLEGHTGFRGQWWWVVGAPLGIYFIGQALDDYVWTPLIQGKETGMDTPTILFATLAGGALFGVFGLLIAIPIAACVKILIQEIFWPRFKAWAEGRRSDPLPID